MSKRKLDDTSIKTSQPLEDRALKAAAQFFGRELLPLLGIDGRIRRIAPTEQVHLQIKDFQEDFNFEMEDDMWYHLEFESDGITIRDLRRFRSYEAVTGYYYDVDVITYVICTSEEENIREQQEFGINTYRVKVIRLQNEEADRVLQELRKQQKENSLTRESLIQLLLVPLMGSEATKKERIIKCLEMLRANAELVEREEQQQMEAVLYAFALKFLSKSELESMWEVFSVTILGQIIEEKGMEKGMEKGLKAGREQGEKSFALLTAKLLKDSRTMDLLKATGNREFRESLYEEYGIDKS